MPKKSSLKGSGGKLEAKCCFQRQSFTKYLRQIVVSCEIKKYGKVLISIFEKIFSSIKKFFILGGKLDTRLKFYGFLRFS